jgi:hypothetical protein
VYIKHICGCASNMAHPLIEISRKTIMTRARGLILFQIEYHFL